MRSRFSCFPKHLCHKREADPKALTMKVIDQRLHSWNVASPFGEQIESEESTRPRNGSAQILLRLNHCPCLPIINEYAGMGYRGSGKDTRFPGIEMRKSVRIPFVDDTQQTSVEGTIERGNSSQRGIMCCLVPEMLVTRIGQESSARRSSRSIRASPIRTVVST